jgi:hypothetical protein
MVDSQKNPVPSTCEDCGVALTPDLQCPKCGVSHTAAPCATCGRVGLHTDTCDEPPGFDTEAGPAFNARLDKILWYVKEVNLYNGEDVAEYATNFWRDLLDRVL